MKKVPSTPLKRRRTAGKTPPAGPMGVRVPRHIAAVPAYVPGRPIEEVERDYGVTGAVKLASNENPMGPSPAALEAVRRGADAIHRYPDGSGKALIAALAETLDLPAERFVLGNGSDEIITLLTRALLSDGDSALMPKPAFLMYEIAVKSVGAIPVEVPLKGLAVDLEAMASRVRPDTRLLFLNNPHNPTGSLIAHEDFNRFLLRLPAGIVVVVDEAYIEFVRDPSCLDSLAFSKTKNPVVTLRTFSKAYGLAGLRIGYGIMPVGLVEILNRIRAPFNTNSLAQIAAEAALKDPSFVKKTVGLVHTELDFLSASLKGLGLTVFPSHANFFLVDVKQDADAFFHRLLQEGVIIRSMTAYGYPEYIRISVGLHSENVRLVEAMKRCL